MGLLRLAMESIFQEDKRFEAEYKQDSRIFGFALIQLMKVVFSKKLNGSAETDSKDVVLNLERCVGFDETGYGQRDERAVRSRHALK
jgi:hypothetical protein